MTEIVTITGTGTSPPAVSGTALATKPSLVVWHRLRFVVMDAPRPNNLHLYLRELEKHNVVCVVRVCEPTYPASDVTAAGIQLLEMEYDDGDAPPPHIINQWVDLVRTTFKDAPDSSVSSREQGPAIAVHCVAGLGRAPVLVAIALIENGLDPIDAVEYIRSRRRGAINRKQLAYLESYERTTSSRCVSCTIM
ncbi:unnamed protein product [Choristocarpus tenellus]